MYIIYAVNKIGCQPYKKEFCGCFVGPGKSQHNLRFLLSWLFFPICCLFSVKFYLCSLKKDNSSNNSNHNSRVLLLMATCNFMKINLGLLLRAVCRDCFREVHCCQSCLRTISPVRPCVCLTVAPLQICVRRTYIVLWMLLVLFFQFQSILTESFIFWEMLTLFLFTFYNFSCCCFFFRFLWGLIHGDNQWGEKALDLPSILEQQFTLSPSTRVLCVIV